MTCPAPPRYSWADRVVIATGYAVSIVALTIPYLLIGAVNAMPGGHG